MDDQKIKEIVYMATQATKSENSGLIQDLRRSVAILEEHHKSVKEILERIESQTMTTNEKVTAIQKWREQMSGGIKVVLIVVVPLLSWALYQVSNIDHKVQTGISAELSKYDIEIQK